MLKRFLQQVSDAIAPSASAPPSAEELDSALRLATAVLMVDVARADHDFDESEFDALLKLISAHFRLSAQDASELANHAGETAEEAVSLHDFTQLLHEHLDDEEKSRIVSLLWQVAYADGRLDKYEDALVLKISDLLYVDRARVMRLKHDAAKAAEA